MVTTVLIVVIVALAAVAVATLVNRRTPDAPTTPKFAVPQQLDRGDFDDPGKPWLLALFSSETCLSCRDARVILDQIELPDLAVQDLAVETHRSVHDRYAIDAVPTVVLADAHGVVRWSFLGAPPPEAVRDALVDAGLVRPDEGTAVDLP